MEPRLTAASYSSGESYSYTYDPVGNRLTMSSPQGGATYTYDAANRLTSVNGVQYTWDANGNLLSDGVRSYTYDHANRLTQVVSGTLTTQYAYNGDGVRTSKTVGDVTTQYLVDLVATLPVVISDTEAIYLYGLDIIAQQQSEARRYYGHEGLGSVRQLTSASGEIAETFAYDPFGVPLQGDSVYNPYRFTGEAWDPEVELLYLRARYYQAATGRFLTRDTWPGDRLRPGTLNWYVYVTNNPANLVDPTGLNGEDPPGVAIWIRRQMVQNAQSPIIHWLADLNQPARSQTDLSLVLRKAVAYKAFYDMVRPGGPWDPKPQIKKEFGGYHQYIAGYWYYYDIWGNIMFGYLGRAGGFSTLELLNGAGAVQFFSDIKYAIEQRDCSYLPRPRPWYYGPILLAPPWMFDHPQDRVTVTIGIRLWTDSALSLQPEHIIAAVRAAGEKGEIPRYPRRPL